MIVGLAGIQPALAQEYDPYLAAMPEEQADTPDYAEEHLNHIAPAPPVLENIKSQLVSALVARGMSNKIAIRFVGREEDIAAQLENSQPDRIAVEVFDIDERSGVFSVLARFTPYGQEEEKYARFKAKFEEVVQVPVVRNRVARGEVIGPEDIFWIDYRRDRIRPDTVLAPEDMIGKAAKRLLVPGKPIRKNILESPAVVQKNDRVRMLYKTPNVKIVTFGIALEDGGKDAYIPVKNLSSSRVIHAKVVDRNQVIVNSMDMTEEEIDE